MHILFFAQCYAPEDVSAAVLITELAEDLVQRGHQVTVVTGIPSYPFGRVFPGYHNRFLQKEFLNGVQVIRVWSYISPKKTFWPRILHYGTYSALALAGGFFTQKPDVIVSYSPPLPLGLSAWVIKKIRRIPWVLQLEDLYPDAAIAAGVLRNQWVIRFFQSMEKFEYRRADKISVICENFRRNLLEKEIPNEKICLIPVWADPDWIHPLPKENTFRRQYQLVGKFVILYAGNMGHTSCLEGVLEAAVLLKNQPEICFVLIGEGVKKSGLEETVRSQELNNVILLPFQSRVQFPEILAAADLSLVTINQNAALSSLPSKVFNVMASARPVLAVAPLDSDVAQLIIETDCGVVVPPGDPKALEEVVIQLINQESRLLDMGRNGRKAVEGKFSREKCVDSFEEMLLSLAPIDKQEQARKWINVSEQSQGTPIYRRSKL